MNPGLDYYNTLGRQAWGYVKFLKVPAGSFTLTVADASVQMGVNIFGNNPEQVAESFAAYVNCDRNKPGLYYAGNADHKPNRLVFAIYYCSLVLLLARVPGTSGNSITITVEGDTTGAASVSANFTDGTDTWLKTSIQNIEADISSIATMKAYDNLVALRAESSYSAGSIALTRGAATPFDGDGTTYSFDASDASVPDYAHVKPNNIAVENPGRWRQI